MKQQIKPGDTVFSRDWQEHWIVAAISPDGKCLMCAGYPATLVSVSNCDLIESCSEAESRGMLLRCMNLEGNDIRKSWANSAWENQPEMCVGNFI